jgi:hypothetical protein
MQMKGLCAWSVQHITTLTTAKTAMKDQSTNTQDTEFFRLAKGKFIKVYELHENDSLG